MTGNWIFNAKWYNTAVTEVHMAYIPGYDWYVISGLSLTPKQREAFEVQFCNECEKREKVVLGEKGDIGLWIQTWSNLENMTITSTFFITLQHTQQFSI